MFLQRAVFDVWILLSFLQCSYGMLLCWLCPLILWCNDRCATSYCSAVVVNMRYALLACACACTGRRAMRELCDHTCNWCNFKALEGGRGDVNNALPPSLPATRQEERMLDQCWPALHKQCGFQQRSGRPHSGPPEIPTCKRRYSTQRCLSDALRGHPLDTIVTRAC